MAQTTGTGKSAARHAAKQDTRQVLIDTTLELMWTHSYGSVSVDDICKAANVKKGSFYHFFPSKVDLAVTALQKSAETVIPVYDVIFAAEVPPLERFRKMAEYVYQSQVEAMEKYGRVCGCPCASVGSEMSGQEEAIRDAFNEIIGRQKRVYYEATLRDLVAAGLMPPDTDVAVKAEEVYAYMLGQMMVARIRNDLSLLKRDLWPGLLNLLGIPAEADKAA